MRRVILRRMVVIMWLRRSRVRMRFGLVSRSIRLSTFRLVRWMLSMMRLCTVRLR